VIAIAEYRIAYIHICMTDEYDIGLFYKRAQAAGEFLGDDAWGAGQVAKLSGY